MGSAGHPRWIWLPVVGILPPPSSPFPFTIDWASPAIHGQMRSPHPPARSSSREVSQAANRSCNSLSHQAECHFLFRFLADLYSHRLAAVKDRTVV